MDGECGVKVCMTTSPSSSPLPALPATWVMSWKVRSPARKSGTWSPRSAFRMPTRVTFGKWRPLAIIWVPMMMSILLALNLARVSRSAFLRRMVSASMRAILDWGNIFWMIFSTFSVPNPWRRIALSPHSGHFLGVMVWYPHMWQTRRSSALW